MADATKKVFSIKTSDNRSTTTPTSEVNPNPTEFFADELKDIYCAEKQLVKTFPKMQKAATSTDLMNAFATI
jgi:hypothetical protein